MTEEHANVGLKVSARWAEWFKAEKKRRGMTAKGLCDELAQVYILEMERQEKGASPWPVE